MQYDVHLLRHTRSVIGGNIHHIRACKNITLHKLAGLSFVPERLLDQYELGKGEIRLDELIRIACALKVKPERLMAEVMR